MSERSPKKAGATTRNNQRVFDEKAAKRRAIFSGMGPTDNWWIPIDKDGADFNSKVKEWGLCADCALIDLDWATERELSNQQFNLCQCEVKYNAYIRHYNYNRKRKRKTI